MTAPSLSQPWVLIPYGKAPPALAYLTGERETFSGPGFFCDLMVVEINSCTGLHECRKRREYGTTVHARDILHVFPGKPSPYHVAEARRALRRAAK
jgi:hypothetical protein